MFCPVLMKNLKIQSWIIGAVTAGARFRDVVCHYFNVKLVWHENIVWYIYYISINSLWPAIQYISFYILFISNTNMYK